jgi:LPXTG-motif cell wall-anchored protein
VHNLQNLTASSEQGKEGVFFEGMLNPGTYYLEEITVPDGYIGPLGRFELTVSAEEAPVVKGTWISGDPDDVQGIVTGNLTEGFTVTVRNTAGYALPSTGGRGTSRIYLLGLMFTSLAGAGLVMRKRRRAA